MVFAIFAQVIPSVEDFHLVIEPVFPESKTEPLFEPLQTVSCLVAEPPIESGLTVIVAIVEFAAVQVPF